MMCRGRDGWARLLLLLGLSAAGCGAKSELLSVERLAGGAAGAGGAGPAPCAEDAAPVVLATGLTDPYALGGDASSLFVGQLESDLELLRIPKEGGPAEVMVAPVSFVELMIVQEGRVFYSDEGTVSSISVQGGEKSTLASAFGPAGFALTPDRIYLAEYFAQELVEIDRKSLDTEVLGTGFSGIYRVGARGDEVYFSTFLDGLYRFHLSSGALDVVAPEVGGPRAIRVVGQDVYFTVPSSQRVFRLPPGGAEPVLVADLSALGVFPEALETDGTSLYLTLATGSDPGLVVSVPLGGGEAEVIAEGGGPQPSALVVDEACVYWTERSTGSVLRARKSAAP
jgi:hypothetical protein